MDNTKNHGLILVNSDTNIAEFISESSEDTQKLGQCLGYFLKPGDTVLLEGDLGSGKSVFVRSVAAAMGITGPMPSPTFTLMQPYCIPETVNNLKEYQGQMPVQLCHYDLYRLEDEEEFFAAGLEEPIGRDICLIEWPLQDLQFPDPIFRVQFDRRNLRDINQRKIRLTWQGIASHRQEELLNSMLADKGDKK